jgi:hypothetical protein
LAYVVGSSILFGLGRYLLETGHGQHFLAHELAHVAQPGGTGSAGQSAVGRSSPTVTSGPHAIEANDGPAERKADSAAIAVQGGAAVVNLSRQPVEVSDRKSVV